MSTKKKNREELQLLRDEALEAYLNREDFQYDVNSDALYRQYKDRYQDLGKRAMMDTMGQAAALTGGYGSSYAQNVGQQAYHQQLKGLNDVVPELYQLAYDRYQDRGEKLYRVYEDYRQQEQEAAAQEQWQQEQAKWEREFLEDQRRWEQEQQEKQRQFELEYDLAVQKQSGAGGTKSDGGDSQLGDYYAWLSYYQGQGSRTSSNDPTVVTKYDNQNVSTGNIMVMQRAIGVPETGMWSSETKRAAGGLSADEAWRAYQRGQLQNRVSVGMGDMGVSTGNIRAMERALGVKDDGIWSNADAKAAGNRTADKAWEAYQRGQLQLRR